MAAAQTIDLQECRKLGKGTDPAYALLRKHISYMDNNRVFHKDQERAASLIRTGILVDTMEKILNSIK